MAMGDADALSQVPERIVADYAARAIAMEAAQLARSHEEMDKVRFNNIDKLHDLIQKDLSDLKISVTSGFRSYDAKFWSLAVMTIALLLTVVGTLLFQILFHH